MAGAAAFSSSSNSSSSTSSSPSCTSYKSPPVIPLFPVRSLSLTLSPNSIAGSDVSNFFSDCFLTSTMARSSSRLRDKQKRNPSSLGGHVTPTPTQNTTTTSEQQSASQRSASQQSASHRSGASQTTKRTPTIKNPYKKTYSGQKRRPPPPQPPDDEIIEVNLSQQPLGPPRPVVPIVPAQQSFTLSIPVEFRPTGIAPHLLPLQPNTLDGSIDFTSIVAPQSERPFSLPSILKSMQDNPIVAFGDIDVSHLTKNSAKYQKEKIHMEAKFFATLESHPVAKPLAKFIANPDIPSEETRMFYLCCGGTCTPTKRKLLNWCLLLFSSGLYLKKAGKVHPSMDPKLFAEAQYEPAS